MMHSDVGSWETTFTRGGSQAEDKIMIIRTQYYHYSAVFYSIPTSYSLLLLYKFFAGLDNLLLI